MGTAHMAHMYIYIHMCVCVFVESLMGIHFNSTGREGHHMYRLSWFPGMVAIHPFLVGQCLIVFLRPP